MKLKKIVSLALAGIMAVSMLTACGEGADNDENNKVVPTSNVVTYANNALTASQKEYGAFIGSSDLDTQLKAVATDAANFSANDIKTASATMNPAWNNTMEGKLNGKLSGIVENTWGTLPADKVARKYGWVLTVSGSISEESAIDAVVKAFATAIGNKQDVQKTMTIGTTLYNCEYSAEISALKVTNSSLDNESAWVVAIVMTQKVTKAANSQV